MSNLSAMKQEVVRAFEEARRPVPDIEQTDDCLNIGDYQIWYDDECWTLGLTVYVVEILCQGQSRFVARYFVNHIKTWEMLKPTTPSVSSPVIVEGRLFRRDVDIEDGGQAMISELTGDAEEGFFVRMQSWSDTKEHPVMLGLIGKKLRITVEILDEDEEP